MADVLRNLPQKRAEDSSVAMNPMYNPKPQIATERLNKLQRRVTFFRWGRDTTNNAEKTLVMQIKAPETAK
jgi:hypothetical protein